MLLRAVARPLLSAVFIGQGLDSLRNPHVAADAARPTLTGLRKLPAAVAEKVPVDAQGFALTNAAIQIAAGMLLASGKLPRVASAALAGTVLFGNLGAHTFWNEDDPERKARKRQEFLTDLSLLGGLMIASADTAGKPSLGWRGRRAAQRVSATIASAAPGGGSEPVPHDSEFGAKLAHGVHLGAERGRELIGEVTEKGAPLVDAARQRGGELAQIARERGPELVSELVDAGRRLPRSVS